MLRIIGLVTFLFIGAVVVSAQSAESKSSKPEIPTVKYCDLVRNPDLYDGKEVRVRTTYDCAGMFLVSRFVDDCTNDDNSTWVEFDRGTIKTTSRPEVVRQLEKEILYYEGNFVASMTEMLVIGVFHKSGEVGHGRERRYHFLFRVKTIEEIGLTKRI